MKFTDTHTHSTFSQDSTVLVTKAIETAIATGLAGISFTDHWDVGVPEGAVGDHLDVLAQQTTIQENIQLFGGKIHVYKGIELGLQLHCIEEIKKNIEPHRFDIVIGSIHLINKVDPYCGDFYLNRSQKEAYREYLEYYVDCFRQFDDFDVLGHYDYISRYAPYKDKTLTYRAFSDQFDTLFNIAINKGKALELNTRSFVTRNNQTSPQFDPEVYKRFREMGGELVCLGSDAHNTNQIGGDFAFYAARIKQCGFKYLTHFHGRKPVCTLNEF